MKKSFEANAKNFRIAVLTRIIKYKYALAVGSLLLIAYIFLIDISLFSDPVSTVLLDRNGQLLGARVAGDGQWRFPGSDSVPEKVIKATLAFEDRYYYMHPGINPVSLVRAAYLNIKAGRVVSGGSTLTMQTIRLSRKGKGRTMSEKIVEMVMATRLELSCSKEEILALYTSNAPYGGNVVGIEAASWRYFATGSSHLSWAEAATLAVLPNSPALVHPGKNREILKRKRNLLLMRLNEIGWLDSLSLQASLVEPIPEKPLPMPRLASHLLDRTCLEHPGKIVTASINASLQEQVSELVDRHHKRLSYNEIHNVSALIIEVETGQILAYVGNCSNDEGNSHANNVDIIAAPRSTGSLLKPLLYAAVLDDGKILPGSLIADIPINLSGFAPQNFNGQFEGAIPASRALSRSLNVPAVQLLKQYGVERFHHLLRSLGMQTLNRPSGYYGLSLILGGAEGTLEEMSNIYASLTRILNHYGKTGLYYEEDYRPADYSLRIQKGRAKGNEQPGIFSASSIWFAYQAMMEVNRPEEEAGWAKFHSANKVAWKTGTSFGYRDGWAIGTTPDYVVGVWVGNADGEGRPGLTGIGAAAPILFDIFRLLPMKDAFPVPTDELVQAPVCKMSGFIAGDYCTDKQMQNIPRTGIKSPLCPYHRLVHLSSDEKFRVNGDCYPVSSMKHVSWFVLPPIQEWYYKKHHGDYQTLPSYMNGCASYDQKSMDLIYPREEVKIYIPREFGGNKGRVVFEAVHANPDALIYWHLDDQFLTTTKFLHQVELLPSAGKHLLVLVDEEGEELVKPFEVIEP